ncbi:tRNA1Val (adenine37-N6)-methyltransferase [Moheibacter sediminis]|uniref:tRNA1(Val) (adenine(37)-N6)-methyltransferase n=2 Tax=Moheibacter sediminis TaxID=1434700 RepID=A0A1W1Y7J6_9FLAO|nr:tRNA1Val (adenine37-N6)-methyltransferase [Moheibacter sediminis]
MKIGTDGVLLGAWANAKNPKKILDIGTGTGLILLMLAQRFPQTKLTGIEINENAFTEAWFNISESVFKERCSVIHSSLQEFNSEEKFDLIVSNPPFFEFTHKENSARNTARQQSDLSFEDLISHAEKLLSSNGKFAVVIPFESENHFVKLSIKLNLFPEKITRVKGNENADFKRSLMLFSRKQLEIEMDELIIEISRNIYTADYISLTKDFYLKM